MEAAAFWVGFAASVGTILQLSGEVIKYIEDATVALDERQSLRNQIIATRDVLRSLEVRAKRDDWKSTMNTLNAPRGPLAQFRDVLEMLKEDLRPASTSTGRFAERAKWYFSKHKINKMVATIEHFKTLFSLALQSENLYHYPILIC
jgi:hypothetical protein